MLLCLGPCRGCQVVKLTSSFSHPGEWLESGDMQKLIGIASKLLPTWVSLCSSAVPERVIKLLSSSTFYPFRTNKPQTSPSLWSWLESKHQRPGYEEARKTGRPIYSNIPASILWDQLYCFLMIWKFLCFSYSPDWQGCSPNRALNCKHRTKGYWDNVKRRCQELLCKIK